MNPLKPNPYKNQPLVAPQTIKGRESEGNTVLGITYFELLSKLGCLKGND